MSDKSTVVPYTGKWWMDKLNSVEKNLAEKWHKSAKKALEQYLDDRQDEDFSSADRKYNIFWANVQILKSALYANPPKPTITRQHGDAKDDVARVAALILERMLNSDISRPGSVTHDNITAAVEDRLLPGLGQVWMRYEPTIEKVTYPAEVDELTGIVITPEIEGEKIVDEKVCVDYVNWNDFLWSPARRWNEVWWVARRHWMGKKKFTEKFGATKWDQIKNTTSDTANIEQDLYPKGFRNGKAQVFEIWCETTSKVYFVCEALTEVLKEVDDPLGLDDFWPCPMPLLATHTNESLIPRPDYAMVQDQYEELNTLNSRIAALTKALRVVGMYDKDNVELQNLLTGRELTMIPVENWAMLSENGGVAKAVDWFPVEQVAGVLKELMVQRQSVIGQIYELTSISDIMRGASNPRETARAQALKAQYSSVRLRLTQADVAKFAQSVLRLEAEIICKHFQPETIMEKSQIQFSESAQFAAPAVELLKNSKMAEYRIEISEESLSMADYTAEREMRIELVTAVGQFLSQAAAMLQNTPQALPYLLRLVQWVVAAFRGSSDVETLLDEAVQAAQQPQQPQGEQKDPPVDNITPVKIKAESDMAIAQLDNQTKLQLENMRLQIERMKIMSKYRSEDEDRESNETIARITAEAGEDDADV